MSRNKPLATFGKSYVTWLSRFKAHDEVIDIAGHLSRARRALLILPRSESEFDLALDLHKRFLKQFPNLSSLYLVHEEFKSKLPAPMREKAITITQDDITTFGIPKRTLINRLAKDKFDLIIDLNSTYDQVSTFLVSKLDAVLRICLSHPNRDKFYNFLIRTSDQTPVNKRYDHLLRYLRTPVGAGAA